MMGSAKPPAERSEARSEAIKAPSKARLIKYIYIKKTAAKPPAERSEANKVPSAARLPERV